MKSNFAYDLSILGKELTIVQKKTKEGVRWVGVAFYDGSLC